MKPKKIKLPVFKTFGEMLRYIKDIAPQKNLCHAPRCREESCYGAMTEKGWVEFCKKHAERLFKCE